MTGIEHLLDHLPSAPQRRMLGDEVYDSLKILILNHVIRSGTRLNIDALTREFGTSSTPVREALARLESEGLATKIALRGYSVTPVLTAAQIAELYELRLMIEPWAAGRAAIEAGPEDIGRLRKEIAQFRVGPEGAARDDFKDYTAHDARLHGLILELAGNETIRRTLERTHAHLHIYRVSYGTDIGNNPAAENRRVRQSGVAAEHHELVDAIATGSRTAAASAMRKHLRAARDRLVAAAESLERQGGILT
jgi:DNA-binding GntR family transcriptional regulator